MDINESSILFSYQDEITLRIYLYVNAKYYIYANTFSGNGLSLQSLKTILKENLRQEIMYPM